MNGEPVFGRLLKVVVSFVVVGGPMALYVWHVLSETLAGRFEVVPFVVAVILAAAFLVLARVLGGSLWRLQEPTPGSGDRDTPSG